MYFHADRAALEAALTSALGDEAPSVIAAIRPCAGLIPTDSPAGRSRLGGAPLVPADFEWPIAPAWVPAPPRGLLERLFGGSRKPRPPHPMAFIAQIDLAEVPPPVRDHLHLPAEGLLAFFHDTDSPWRQDARRRANSRIRLFTGAMSEAPFPADLPAQDRLPATPLALQPGWMTPGEPPLSEDAEAAWFEILSLDQSLKAPERFLGGWPIAAQSNVLVEADMDLGILTHWPDDDAPQRHAAEARWRQLLQLRGGEPSLRRLNAEAEVYVLMDEGDLAAGRWEQAWVAVQYY